MVTAECIVSMSAFTAAPDKDQLYNLRSKPATAKLLAAGRLEPELLSRINHCVAGANVRARRVACCTIRVNAPRDAVCSATISAASRREGPREKTGG